MIKAVIFDFNGTLYMDHDINEITWRETINNLTNNRINFDEFYFPRRSMHDHLMIKDAIKPFADLKDTDIDYWVDYKEKAYRNYCVDHSRNKMVNGAEQLLDYLKENNYPIGLCTSSIIENVEFYYSNLNLNRWFSMDKTIYDNGTYTSKKEMYEDCAKLMKANMNEVLVFEDSPGVIKAVIEANPDSIIAINRMDSYLIPDYPKLKQRIDDFTKLDYSIFANGDK